MEIYLDNSATTKPYNEVVEEMVKALTTEYGNPSSLHKKGIEVDRKIKEIRQNIARTLGTKDKEIFFTSGGTESNNTIIRGVAYNFRKIKNHIISTVIEHPSVLNTLADLEKEGFEITLLEVDESGKINIEDLKKAIKPSTILISTMHVNNEVGSIQPIEEIGKYLKTLDEKIYFHVDCVQSYTKIKFRPSSYNIDFMTVSGHKFHGPKGIGFMYIKENSKLKPIITGGGQESSVRSGTENVPGIYGLGKAVEIMNKDLDSKIEKIENLKNLLKEKILKNIDGVKINSPEDGVCHILNVSFENIRGEVLLHFLEQKNIYVSTGSACSSKKKGSHVLNAIKLTPDEIEGAIRFSLSDFNTEEEILETVKVLKDSINDLRMIIKRR